MLSRIAQQTLLYSLIAFVFIWGYIPFLWNMNWPAMILLGLAGVSLIAWIIAGLASLKVYLSKRATQFGIGTLITSIGVLVILVALNFVANLYNNKKDITSSQLYSLSGQSKNVAAQLKEDVEIEVWTTNIQRMTPNQDLQKFLENYRIESGGKVKISIRNPNEDLSAKERNITKDNVIIIRASQGREARVENVNQEKVEEQVTNALVQAIKGVKKMICFTSDHGEMKLDDADKMGLSLANQSLQAASYQSKAIAITSMTEVPSDCEALVIAGPKSEPTDSGLSVLQKYIEADGKAFILLSANTPQKWNSLIKPYGVELRNDIVVDLKVQPPTAVATQNFARNVEIVSSFDRMVVMLQSSSLAVPTSGKSGNFDVKTFISSEPHTFAKKKTGASSLKAEQTSSDLRGPLALAVLIEDPRAASTNEAKPADSSDGHEGHDHGHDHGSWRPSAEWLGISSARADEPPPPPTGTIVETEFDASQTKIIVVGNELFASNAFINQLGNIDLFMNSLNYLLEDKDVIGIRPRDLKATRLELSPETDRQVQATVYLLAGLCFVGAFMTSSRRRKMSI